MLESRFGPLEMGMYQGSGTTDSFCGQVVGWQHHPVPCRIPLPVKIETRLPQASRLETCGEETFVVGRQQGLKGSERIVHFLCLGWPALRLVCPVGGTQKHKQRGYSGYG